jgi:glutathione S-transferase
MTANQQKIVLYSIPMSHSARAAQLMLEHEGLDHRVRQLPAGLHPVLLRALGFKGSTVPAVSIGGRRVQGTLDISRALDGLGAGPRLFPTDEDRRREVEEIERWGEAVYQPIPRRIFRWGATIDRQLRVHMATESSLPLPRAAGRVSWPAAAYFAHAGGASETTVRAALAELPSHIEHIDKMIGEGILGSDSLNAADFQVGATSRILMNFPQIRALYEGRPAGEHALRMCPHFGVDVPFELPAAALA